MNADAIASRMRDEARRRLAKAASYFAGQCKKTVSVPAPYTTSRTTGRRYATTRAIPGAPPRKLSGRGRASISWRLETGLAATVGTNVGYMGVHERHDHKWVEPTLVRERSKVNAILAGGGP